MASTLVRPESASRTFIIVPAGVGVLVTASSGVKTDPVAGISLLASTTVLMPFTARLPSTLESASPSAGQAIEVEPVESPNRAVAVDRPWL